MALRPSSLPGSSGWSGVDQGSARPRARALLPAAVRGALTALLLAGCAESGRPDGAAARPSASAVTPGPPASAVAAQVNPKGRTPYAGPVGTVRGVVRVTGPEAPPVPADQLGAIPDRCAGGRPFHARLYREGPGRTLADALVAVTGYDGFVPARAPAVAVHARDCTWGTRTIAATFGQRIEVFAKGADGHMPQLLGSGRPAVMVALPGGDPVPVYPPRVGRFTLSDAAHVFMQAEVFVLRYSTTAVTGLDGVYSIEGVPAGEVEVAALLPVTGATAQRKITVPAGGAVEVDLEVPFVAPAEAVGSAAGSGSAAPTAGSAASAASAAPAVSAPAASAGR